MFIIILTIMSNPLAIHPVLSSASLLFLEIFFYLVQLLTHTHTVMEKKMLFVSPGFL